MYGYKILGVNPDIVALIRRWGYLVTIEVETKLSGNDLPKNTETINEWIDARIKTVISIGKETDITFKLIAEQMVLTEIEEEYDIE